MSLADFSPDGLSFAAGESSSRRVRIWSAESGEQIKTWQLRIWPDEVAFNSDGTRLLVTSWRPFSFGENSLLLDVSKGAEVAALRGHKSDTHGGSFSHSGRLAATVSLDGTARLWDSVTGNLRAVLGEETAGLRLTSVSDVRDQEVNSAFSRDNRLLATASIDGGVRVWNVESGSPLTALSGHQALVEHLEFSPADDTLLLTASHDGTARLWDSRRRSDEPTLSRSPADICGLQPRQRAPCDGRWKSGGASVGCRQQP